MHISSLALRSLLVLLLALSLCGCIKEPVKKEIAARPMAPPAALLQEILDDQKYTVSGGWGFKQDEPMVFSIPDKVKPERDTLTVLQRCFVDIRNTEEFSRSPAFGQRSEVMGFTLESQISLKDTATGKLYDRIVGTVQVIPEHYLPELITLAEKYKAGDEQAINTYRARTETLRREYWFDITQPDKQNKGKFGKLAKKLVE